MANNTNSRNLFAKYPALKAVAGVAVIAAFLFIAISLRNSSFLAQLDTQKSDAACYGYGYNSCIPSVNVYGRVVIKGYENYNYSYGTLNIKAGQVIELAWNGQSVDRCVADWTQWTGTNMPPTVYGKVNQNQNFNVVCYKGREKVASKLVVHVSTPVPPIKPTLSTGRNEPLSE